MTKTKALLTTLAIGFTCQLSVAYERPFPVSDVQIVEKDFGLALRTRVDLNNSCLDTEVGLLTVNESKDIIRINQQVERSQSQACLQVINTVYEEYPLKRISEGDYKVFDAFDGSLIRTVTINK